MLSSEFHAAERDVRIAEEGLLTPTSYGSMPQRQTLSTDALLRCSPLKRMRHIMPLPPEDSVYSYLLFMPPIEQRRTKRHMTWLTFFAVALVIVNFFMQSGLLYVVGQYIMTKHTEWVSSIAHLQHPAWYHVVPMAYNLPQPKCKGKDSPLCFQHGHGISCSPLSIHALTDDWARLDIDGDGVWTREEAGDAKLREAMQCDYNVVLPSLYETVVAQINSSNALQGRRDMNLLSGRAVHKAYLDWYLHKPLLCQYGGEDMCGALFKRGFFDEALRQQPLSGFNDTASALKYCNNILKYECFNMLPNTYRVWRQVSNQQCGEKLFSQISYRSPVERDAVMPLLSVDFRKRIEYASTKGITFRVFLGILLITFLSVMALEMRGILKAFLWCTKFPADRESGQHGQVVGQESVIVRHSAEQKSIISAVRRDHRFVVFVVTMLRLVLWFFLLWSGVMFLTGPPRYLAMIFDALSLLFIFEIDELLYRTMLHQEFRNDHMNIEDMEVPQWHQGFLKGWMMVMGDAFGFLLVITCGLAIVHTYTQNELNPLLESLECLCSVQGPQCYGAGHYSKAWWDNYWSATLPTSKVIIDAMTSPVSNVSPVG